MENTFKPATWSEHEHGAKAEVNPFLLHPESLF